jgi:hypothetical protein
MSEPWETLPLTVPCYAEKSLSFQSVPLEELRQKFAVWISICSRQHKDTASCYSFVLTFYYSVQLPQPVPRSTPVISASPYCDSQYMFHISINHNCNCIMNTTSLVWRYKTLPPIKMENTYQTAAIPRGNSIIRFDHNVFYFQTTMVQYQMAPNFMEPQILLPPSKHVGSYPETN